MEYITEKTVSLELTKRHIAKKQKLNSQPSKESNSSQNVNSNKIYQELKRKYQKQKATKTEIEESTLKC